jgi:hypothetical protein
MPSVSQTTIARSE